jgi:hypothetical protein
LQYVVSCQRDSQHDVSVAQETTRLHTGRDNHDARGNSAGTHEVYRVDAGVASSHERRMRRHGFAEAEVAGVQHALASRQSLEEQLRSAGAVIGADARDEDAVAQRHALVKGQHAQQLLAHAKLEAATAEDAESLLGLRLCHH